MSDRPPQRGEIWFIKISTDPLEKGRRPVIVVSSPARNNHPRARTVLVVPLSPSVQRRGVPTHLTLEPAETGLPERVIAKAEDISVLRKESLEAPPNRLITLADSRICELARMVTLAMDCL
jgi:mRNA-degrading endonuclease toxin of MazEF toxin-antitoxin module